MRAGHHSNTRHAFSVIELLVVIAIMAALAGLLLPALSRARSKSQAVFCQSNLRSLASASVAYSVQDPQQLLLPVHPTADVNDLHDDGF